MRFLFLCTISLIVFSCSKKDNTSAIVDQSGMTLPAASSVQKYDDIPGLSKVTVRSNGNIIAEGDYFNEKKHGAWTEFYDNGIVRNVTTYFEGIKQGVAIELSEIGELKKKSFYHNGILDGEYLVYERRKIKDVLNYSNGVLNGPKKSFYSNGKPLEESNYVNGKIDGVAKYYNQQGELLYEYTYKDGELVKD